jgi:hypothetical protein
MSRIDVERVIFEESIKVPRDEKGISTGAENVFARKPDAGRTMRGDNKPYDVFLEGNWVIVRDRDSGEEEWVPYTRARQVSISRKPAEAKGKAA